MGKTELSEAEQADRLRQLEEENAQLKRDQRNATVESRVAELSEAGLDKHPGLLKELRNIMLSDDGQPALMLSEDGKGQNAQAQTATEIVERIVSALPTKDGKIALSEQAFATEPHGDNGRPPADASGEKSVEEQADEAARELGLATAEVK